MASMSPPPFFAWPFNSIFGRSVGRSKRCRAREVKVDIFQSCLGNEFCRVNFIHEIWFSPSSSIHPFGFLFLKSWWSKLRRIMMMIRIWFVSLYFISIKSVSSFSVLLNLNDRKKGCLKNGCCSWESWITSCNSRDNGRKDHGRQ